MMSNILTRKYTQNNTAAVAAGFVVVTVLLLILMLPDITLASQVEENTADDEGGGILTSAFSGLASLLYEFVVSVFGFIAGAAGMILNYAIFLFTVGFGSLYINSGLGFAIDNLWALVRDVFNLTFIFGLVYIGLRLILDAEDSRARSALINLIMAALLVNFSLFFTKFIIDASNVLTEQIVTGFGATQEVTQITLGNATIVVRDISGVFVELMDLTSIYGINSQQLVDIDAGGKWALIFVTMIVLLIAAFVFFAGGILLISRFIALNIYLVLSPLMFLGWVFPNLNSFSSQWWSGFLRSAFIAPAYIFMLYLSAKVVESFGLIVQNSNGLTAPITQGADAISLFTIIPYFIVIAGFLLGSVVVAQRMGVAGANASVAISKKVVGRASAGVAARVGRNTLGWAGERAANNQRRLDLAAQSGASGWIARRQLDLARGAAGASFDARNTQAGQSLGLEKGKKGGYSAVVKDAQKRDEAFAKSLGEVSEDDFRVQQRIQDEKRIKNEIQNLKDQKAKLDDNDKDGKVEKDKQIREKEGELKKATEKIESEKRRRQIGSTFSKEEVALQVKAAKDSFDKQKKLEAAAWDDFYSTKVKSERESIKARIETIKEERKKAKDEFDRISREGSEVDGYAQVVDAESTLGKLASTFSGRTWYESKQSADNIRKKFTKQAKKTKEEKMNDSVIDAVKESGKKDDG
ncbi:MAG: hypothetical protein AAGA35_02715 [Patescibacteria group bacterium]